MRRRRWAVISSTALIAIAALLIALDVGAPNDATANPLGNIKQIAAGEGQTCAVMTTGEVECWGDPGLLADASSTGAFPAAVPGTSSATSVYAGLNRTCVVMAGGGVTCWGRSGAPSAVPGLTGVVQVDAGNEYACAVTAKGSVTCWSDTSSPATVEGIDNTTSVDVGIEHTCVVTMSGNVECWGRNQHGELGDGTTSDRVAPVTVSGLTGVTSVATALNHTCALSSSGIVSCWGYRYGASPAVLVELSDVTAIEAAYNHTCALTGTGAARCWGANDYGQLGDGYACGVFCDTPTNVAGLSSGITDIAVGVNHTCALLGDASAKCWGNNFVGQLGNGRGGARAVSPLPAGVVQQESKSDPCPPEGCPTPPLRPVLRNGLDFSVGVDADGDGMEDCGTHNGQSPECTLASGSPFDVIVDLHSLPETMTVYTGTDVILDATYFPGGASFEFLWPDCVVPVSGRQPTSVGFGCSAGSLTSTYSGPMLRIEATCSDTGSIELLHGRGFTSLVDPGLRSHHETSSESESVMITCGEKIAGDVDCSSSVSPIDAALTLQREATIIERVSCEQQADVNMDNTTNSLDAAVTLQYTAGLLTALPIAPG